jgi:protoporphyrinogen/coproporphyrinogen III oxidase
MTENSKHVDVVIIGAGLTGLTTAFYLKKAGISFILVDQKDKVGGVIETHKENSFTIECGPNTGVLSHPEVIELFEELGDSCEIENAQNNVNKRLIWKGNRWHALPSSLIGGIKTPLFSFGDKINILAEPFRKKGTDPNESLAHLVKRRMGQSFLDYAVDPFILGIYAGDPEYLIPRFALPKLYNLEQKYGSFIGGAIKKGKEKKDERSQKATRKIFSVKGGLSNLIKSLENSIGSENIVLGCKNIEIDYNEHFTVKSAESSFIATSKKVVTTVGSYQLPKMLTFLNLTEKEKVDNLEYAKVAQLSIGFNNWEGIDINAFGGLVPYVEKRNILGVLFISSFLQNRAPEKGALLSVFVGGFRNPKIFDLSDEKLVELIEPDLKQMLGLKTFNPDLLKIFRYEYAIPQYGINTGERLSMIKNLEEKFPNLTIAGNLRDGIGMADRIKQGKDIADSILGKI